MVKSVARTTGLNGNLERQVAVLREDGVAEETIEKMVVASEAEEISVQEASDKYDIPAPTLHAWIQRGHLRIVRRRKNPLTRPVTLIDENELKARIGAE